MKLNIRLLGRNFACAYDHLADAQLIEDVGAWLDRHASESQTDAVAESIDLAKRVAAALPGTHRAAEIEAWLLWHDRPEQPAQDIDDVLCGLYYNLLQFAEVAEEDMAESHKSARRALRRALWFGHDE